MRCPRYTTDSTSLNKGKSPSHRAKRDTYLTPKVLKNRSCIAMACIGAIGPRFCKVISEVVPALSADLVCFDKVMARPFTRRYSLVRWLVGTASGALLGDKRSVSRVLRH